MGAPAENPEIEDYDERLYELRGRVAAAGPEEQHVFLTQRIAEAAALREAIEERGEGVEEEMPVSIRHQAHIWEQDLIEMLDAPEVAHLVERLHQELSGIEDAHAAALGPDEPFI